MIKPFVFDTNSLISADLSPNSVNRQAYDKARELGITVYSDETLAEFIEVFNRSKFDKYVSQQSRNRAINAFENSGQHVQVFTHVDICRDKKDNKFLELALDVNAACVITGGHDLLVLHPFK